MQAKATRSSRLPVRPTRMQRLGQSIWQNRWLYVLILPAAIYLILFNYLPMYGIQIQQQKAHQITFKLITMMNQL